MHKKRFTHILMSMFAAMLMPSPFCVSIPELWKHYDKLRTYIGDKPLKAFKQQYAPRQSKRFESRTASLYQFCFFLDNSIYPYQYMYSLAITLPISDCRIYCPFYSCQTSACKFLPFVHFSSISRLLD